MSSHYNNEPPPTASATLQTTVGPVHISLFAKQTPLACQNFLQHCLDGYYNGSMFHRVVSDFIIQGGDPTGTGEGGSSIYEDPECECDPRDGEKVVFRDEIHSRLRFNRRGLVGMAKSEDGSYGSQFFVTLANAERELNGTCTMFGRLEGDSIYHIMTIAEAELIEGTERPVYPVRITGCEVTDLGPFANKLKKRNKIAVAEKGQDAGPIAKKRKKSKQAKVKLNFDEEEGDEEITNVKPKYNTRLIVGDSSAKPKEKARAEEEGATAARSRASLPSKPVSAGAKHLSQVKEPESFAQMPLPDPEVPRRSESRDSSRSPTPPPITKKPSRLERTRAEIEALKASMRRDVNAEPEPEKPKSALEAMIPPTAIRGRKRPGPGGNGSGEPIRSGDSDALKLLNAFKAKLEKADQEGGEKRGISRRSSEKNGKKTESEEKDEEEEQVCDLHFIANCQSCRAWDEEDPAHSTAAEDDNAMDWMSHSLRFGKDTLGKDLEWKRKHEEVDDLMVIDPREKEKELLGKRKGKGRDTRDGERKRKMERAVEHDYEIPAAAAGMASEKASAILSQFERKRRAAALIVPTEDPKVRAKLRELKHPITLFGEDATDRRERLRQVMLVVEETKVAAGEAVDTEMKEAGAEEGKEEEEEEVEEQEDEGNEEFYTEGTPELLAARQDIARYSIPRAKARIERQREESTIPLRTHIKHRRVIKDKLRNFDLFGSQIAGERPISITRFSPNGKMVAAGNWSGGIRLLDVPNLNEVVTLRGHTDRVGGISWLPGATLPSSNISESSVNLASGGGEGNVNLWSLTQDTPLATLSSHTGRVCRTEFHPSGRYLASASYDTTWRLWDVATQQELLLQEGHSREVYSLAFNIDGSLLASGGLDSMGRIWDLRTGRTVMILEGHIREIYALDWSIDGYRILSGSGDGWVKCWDLRQVRETGGVGAHKSVVSDLRWYKGIEDTTSFIPSAPAGEDTEMTDNQTAPRAPTIEPKKSGTFFVTSGFDKSVNVFSADDWSLVKSLNGHTGNVLSVDISPDAQWIASSGHDRTVKLWGIE
ncbi:Peptidyl-prolyl isomerase cwc27 [Ascosphaera aggregata]|nr:Peptidyl-prolyl isomerase cwc27 [Ascosphaera aggregata]